MMYAGNLLGIAVNALLHAFFRVPAENPLNALVGEMSLAARLLFLVILAPLIEEFLFRKQLIDRMRVYGEKTAVITSAAVFGLFHGNLSQLFYAAALGLVFGCVYLKTGRLRYTIGLHMGINFLGGIFGPFLLERAADNPVFYDPELLSSAGFAEIFTPEMLALMAYGLCMAVLAVAGLLLLCISSQKIEFADAELELPRGSRFRTVCLNPGMLLLFLGCMALIVYSAVR